MRYLIKLNQILEMEQTPKPKRIYRKKCRGGLDTCKNYIGDYKDVDGVGCCESCDKYVDDNPYDPYWEQMDNNFEDSKEYEELEKNDLLKDPDAYQDAYEKYVQYYESWPDMRRRMAKNRNKK
jgi:hypothetical protein